MRTLIRIFFAAGLSYSFSALAIYLSGNAVVVIGTSLTVFAAGFYGAGKLRENNTVATLLGISAVILLVFGFIATGYAIKDAEAKRASGTVTN